MLDFVIDEYNDRTKNAGQTIKKWLSDVRICKVTEVEKQVETLRSRFAEKSQ